jgi:hypothetical protein
MVGILAAVAAGVTMPKARVGGMVVLAVAAEEVVSMTALPILVPWAEQAVMAAAMEVQGFTARLVAVRCISPV